MMHRHPIYHSRGTGLPLGPKDQHVTGAGSIPFRNVHEFAAWYQRILIVERHGMKCALVMLAINTGDGNRRALDRFR